jgi:hypothetical protein
MMQRAFGLDVPDTVAEMCRPTAAAVLVYDPQAGILPHVQDREGLTDRIRQVLDAARAAGVPRCLRPTSASAPCASPWPGSARTGPTP